MLIRGWSDLELPTVNKKEMDYSDQWTEAGSFNSTQTGDWIGMYFDAANHVSWVPTGSKGCSTGH